MQVQPSDARKMNVPHQKVPTGGAFSDTFSLTGLDPVIDVQSSTFDPGSEVYEPSPLSAGPVKGGTCSPGNFMLWFNILLHLSSAVLTIIAAAAHFQDDGRATKHLTPHNSFDFVSFWCITMIVGVVLGVFIYVVYFGFVRRAFGSPLVAIIGGGFFLMAFISSLKLSYYLEIGVMGYLDPADGITKNANVLMHNRFHGTGVLEVALYLQGFVLASIFFTAQSGTYFKLSLLERALNPGAYSSGYYATDPRFAK